MFYTINNDREDINDKLEIRQLINKNDKEKNLDKYILDNYTIVEYNDF